MPVTSAGTRQSSLRNRRAGGAFVAPAAGFAGRLPFSSLLADTQQPPQRKHLPRHIRGSGAALPGMMTTFHLQAFCTPSDLTSVARYMRLAPMGARTSGQRPVSKAGWRLPTSHETVAAGTTGAEC